MLIVRLKLSMFLNISCYDDCYNKDCYYCVIFSCESNRKAQTTFFYEDGVGDKNAIMKKALDILIPSKNKSSEMLFVYS